MDSNVVFNGLFPFASVVLIKMYHMILSKSIK